MNTQKVTEFDFFDFVKESELIDLNNDSIIWFIHLNLCDLEENNIPDSSQIADYFFSKIKFPKINFFLVLLDRKRNEKWIDKINFVYYQELIEIKVLNEGQKSSNNFIHKKGCSWKKHLDRNSLLKIIKNNSISPIETIALKLKISIIQTNLPFRLENLKIPKPWGYETWYTGVEKRGVVCVKDKYGRTELPYSLNIFKKEILGDFPEDLILLKILNPYAKEIVGDLYYEMHEKKWEVYIVTEIDKSSWPSGKAIIKAGLNPKKINEYKKKYGKDWKRIFIADFKQATTNFEKIRKKIDDSKKKLPHKYFSQESKLREKAADFVGDCYVKEGDIISFPAYQIHSLQHGIKVIEFQTPHYERLIVMFGQKVLTQNHWDIKEAFEKMKPDVYKPPKLELLHKKNGILLERFVNFPHFTVDRIILKPKMNWKDKLSNQYHILIIVNGRANFENESGDNISMHHEEAIFVPISLYSYTIKNQGDGPLIYLKAMPK